MFGRRMLCLGAAAQTSPGSAREAMLTHADFVAEGGWFFNQLGFGLFVSSAFTLSKDLGAMAQQIHRCCILYWCSSNWDRVWVMLRVIQVFFKGVLQSVGFERLQGWDRLCGNFAGCPPRWARKGRPGRSRRVAGHVF